MSRWITQAVVFGVALSGAAGTGLKSSSSLLSLSGGAPDGNDHGINPAHVMFEYLNQCAQVNLNKDSCLVSKTIDALVAEESMDQAPLANSPTSPPNLTEGRFLQGDCGDAPEFDEESMRSMVEGSKEQCIQSGIAVSDEKFNSTVNGFNQIFGSDSCFEQLCDEQSNPSEALLGIMFDEAAKCAQVDLDADQCIMDQVLEMMLEEEGEDSGMAGEGDRVRRKLQDLSGCEPQNEVEVSLFVSIMLSEAEAKCSESGVSVSSEELDKAASDLTALFMAQHCWGDDGGCDNDNYFNEDNFHLDHHEDGYHSLDVSNGMNIFSVAIKYVEQCAGLDLNMDTCLASGTIDTFGSVDDSSSESSEDGNHDQLSRRRFLETSSDGEECVPPELDELTLRYIIEESKGQCIISEQDFEDTVSDFVDLFSAADCWVSLCEEGSDPSETMLKLVFEEIGQCAGANLDFNPCLVDQILELMFSSDGPDDFDVVRRRLEHTLGGPEESDDPCAEQPNDVEMSFLVSLMMAGAQEQCMELGVTFEAGEIDLAAAELLKLFSAQHCWGAPDNCNEHHVDSHDHDHEYLEFIEESTTWMLGQCVGVTDVSCVFSRSIEVMHGMKHLGWSHDDHTVPQQLAQGSASSMCAPPSPYDYDIDQIADHAMEHCIKVGAPVEDYHYDQAVNDLKNLVAKPDCWEDLCEPEIKDIIVEEWMQKCALVDLDFLTTEEPTMSGDVLLDSDMLRCMADYIVSVKGDTHANMACGLSHLEYGVCNFNIGKEAYTQCGGEEETYPPSPEPTTVPSMSSTLSPTHSLAPSQAHQESASPSNPPTPGPTRLQTLAPTVDLSMSMSLGYNGDGFNWALDEDDEDEPEMSMSLSTTSLMAGARRMDIMIDESVSMSEHGDEYGNDGPTVMSLYIDEVCHLISTLNSDVAKHCLEPVCDGLWIEHTLTHDDNTENTSMPTQSPTSSPTPSPTPSPTVRPTSVPTPAPTGAPNLKPTSKPTRQPTPSPTALGKGEVEVTIEVEVTLEGIDMADIDITSLDKVVNLLSSVLKDLIPEGAIVRILSVGGFSVARRLLRFLEDDATGGVPIEFEIVMKQTCETATCDGDEADEISEKLYKEVTSDLTEKVESGELTTAIQEKAEEQGVSEMSSVTINASTMQVSEAKVTVKEAKDDVTPDDPPDGDDDSSSTRLGVALSMLAVVLSTMISFYS